MTLLLSCSGIKKEYGEFTVLSDISLNISTGDRVGLVGTNGSGKTTLANIIYGSEEPTCGSINWHRKDLHICYLNQSGEYSDNLMSGQGIITCKEEFRDFAMVSSKLGIASLIKEENQKEQEELRSYQGQHKSLSGGEKMKLAIAAMWAQNPEVIILDEPTNHLDYKGIKWLIKELKKYKGTIILISHDRYFLDQTVERILEIESGGINEYNGNYTFYREEKKRRYEAQLAQYRNQEKYKRKIEEQINRLKTWSEKAHRESTLLPPGGVAMGAKEKARAKAKKMDIQVKSRIKRLQKLKIEGIEKPKEERNLKLCLEDAVKGGRRIIEAINIKKQFGNRVLFEKSSFFIQRGEKIALFGNNGSGKTTLLEILLGEEKLEEGELFVSPTVKIAYLSQDAGEKQIDRSIMEFFNPATRMQREKVQGILANMGFGEEVLEKSLCSLSFGEITRIKIAKLIIQENDVLILDEPVNHLDLQSREKLEEALEGYKGTIILVSHDRYMIERICNKLLVFKKRSIKRVEYGINEYLQEQLGMGSESQGKRNKDERLRNLLLDTNIAYILGRLCGCEKGTKEYEELDSQYFQLMSEKNIR